MNFSEWNFPKEFIKKII